MMRATLQGLAPAAPVSAPGPISTGPRPSGRYALRAPDAPVGSVLRVRVATLSGPSTRLVRKEADAIFLDAAGNELAFGDWEYASREECADFAWCRRIEEYADLAGRLGALALNKALSCLPRFERDDVLCGVADCLRERGYPGKASAVLCCRFEEA